MTDPLQTVESSAADPGMATDGDNPVTLSDVAKVVQRHYREELWQAIKAGIGVIASLSLKQRDHCLALIYEGASGIGKSVCVRVFMPGPATQTYLYRIDDFTPASFVSHAANRTAGALTQIDLLPRVKDKVMLTKELAPLFRDNEKEQRQNFARLTSVLDGNGYMTASGTHGTRGYEGRYLFNWLGATTPIPDHTHRVMAQLGNRLLFYEVAGNEPTEEDLMSFAQSYGGSNTPEECRKAVNDFIAAYFQRHPVESVDPDSISIPDDLLREIVRYARLIAHGRVEVEHSEGRSDFEAKTPEGPQRLILLLQTLARGLALADGRQVVTAEDLATIHHIAFSSIPRKRRELLQAVLQGGGVLDSAQVEKVLRVSRPTARGRMQELAATGIVGFTPGDEESSTPAKITLADGWRWLLEAEGTPLKQNGGVSMETPCKRNGGVWAMAASDSSPLKANQGCEEASSSSPL